MQFLGLVTFMVKNSPMACNIELIFFLLDAVEEIGKCLEFDARLDQMDSLSIFFQMFEFLLI